MTSETSLADLTDAFKNNDKKKVNKFTGIVSENLKLINIGLDKLSEANELSFPEHPGPPPDHSNDPGGARSNYAKTLNFNFGQSMENYKLMVIEWYYSRLKLHREAYDILFNSVPYILIAIFFVLKKGEKYEKVLDIKSIINELTNKINLLNEPKYWTPDIPDEYSLIWSIPSLKTLNVHITEGEARKLKHDTHAKGTEVVLEQFQDFLKNFLAEYNAIITNIKQIWGDENELQARKKNIIHFAKEYDGKRGQMNDLLDRMNRNKIYYESKWKKLYNATTPDAMAAATLEGGGKRKSKRKPKRKSKRKPKKRHKTKRKRTTRKK